MGFELVDNSNKLGYLFPLDSDFDYAFVNVFETVKSAIKSNESNIYMDYWFPGNDAEDIEYTIEIVLDHQNHKCLIKEVQFSS